MDNLLLKMFLMLLIMLKFLFPPLAAVVVVAPNEGRPWQNRERSLFARGSPTRGAGGRKPD